MPYILPIAALIIAFGLAWMGLGLSGLSLFVVGGGLFLLFFGVASVAMKKKLAIKGGYGTVALLGIVILGVNAIMPGVWSQAFGAAGIAAEVVQPLSQTEISTQLAACDAMVSGEERAQAATVTLNAYDQEATAGYGTAVDLSTYGWFFRNGNKAGNFVQLSADTADGSVTAAWTIGDSAYAYFGGTSYYTEPVEGLCINGKTVPMVIKTHAASTAAQLSGTGMDKNLNALTAAGNSTTGDYDLTMGASSTDYINLEWTVDTAAKSYNAYGVAIFTYNDFKNAFPVGEAQLNNGNVGSFTAAVAPDYLRQQKVGPNNEASLDNITVTYSVHILPKPVLMNARGDTFKVKLQVDSGATDPSATDNVWSTSDLVVACLIDGQYVKDPASGDIALSFYNLATFGSQTDAGVVGQYYSPVGKDDCIVTTGA